MIRSLVTIFIGQLTIMLLNSIVRMAVGLYLEIDFSLSGITFLPGFAWEVLIVALSVVYGFIAGTVVCLISSGTGRVEILGLTLIIACVGIFDYYYFGVSEPIWYFLINTGLLISGLFLSYRFLKTNDDILEQKVN